MGNTLTAPLPGWNVRGHSYGEVTLSGERHPGLDLNVGYGDDDLGLPVVAVLDGVIVGRRDWNGRSVGYGNLLLIEHTLFPEVNGGARLWSLYAHLDTFQEDAAPGATVTAGQPIATCGKSGYQQHAHLHFELRYKGPPELAIDYWGGRLNPDAQNRLYADPYTLLRLFEGVPLAAAAPEPAAATALAAVAEASERARQLEEELATVRSDRDLNYRLKMAFEACLRQWEGRKRIKQGTTDRMIKNVMG